VIINQRADAVVAIGRLRRRGHAFDEHVDGAFALGAFLLDRAHPRRVEYRSYQPIQIRIKSQIATQDKKKSISNQILKNTRKNINIINLNKDERNEI